MGNQQSTEDEKQQEGEVDMELIQEQLDVEKARMNSYMTLLLKDGKLSTLMEIFLDFLRMPEFKRLQKLLKSLGKAVGQMFDNVSDLVDFVGQDEVNELYAIIHKFSSLLITTNQTLTNVLEQAQIQEQNMKYMIEQISNYTKSKIDKTEFEDCISTLAQWIDNKAIEKLLEQWSSFCVKCQEKHDKWEIIIKNSKSKTDTFGKILKGLAIMGIIGGVSVAILGAILGWPIMVITTSVTVATYGFAVAPIIYRYSSKKNANVIAKDVLAQAKQIKHALKQLLLFGKLMEYDLGDLNKIQTSNIDARMKELEHVNSRKRILESAKNIVKYLRQYQIQGKAIIKNVEEAQKHVISKIKQM